MNKAAEWLKKNLDYTFANEDLLQQALTHRSAAPVNNERLEFLGDSVLQLVISELVFQQRSDASEGRLSRLRSSLVKDSSLTDLATELGIGEYLILGSGEKKSGGHRRASILADAVEAIFGAVYLDAGFDVARDVIYHAYGERITNLPKRAELRDPKSRLQEFLQGRQMALPTYSMESISGKAHKQTFAVSCSIAALALHSKGEGSTRRKAEQVAAQAMLQQLEKAHE